MKPYYEDEWVRLYHGDCREVTAWLEADVLVTDPPYGIAWSRSSNAARSSKAHNGIANDADTAARDSALLLWGDGPAVVFGSLYAPFAPNLRQVLIWQKPADAGVIGSTTGYRRDAEAVFLCGSWPVTPAHSSSVIRSTVPNVGNPSSPAGLTGHPHSKPVDLMGRLILNAPGETVADPFAGSGSTLVAAKWAGRRAIGVELEERYCEIAAKRLAQDTLFGGVA